MTRIDPNDPSTVPLAHRQEMVDAAVRMSRIDRNQRPKETLQMLTDLLALARNDGCIAAGWAYMQLTNVKEVPHEAK